MENEKRITVVIEKQTYEYHKEPQVWTVALRKSEVQVNEKKDLALVQVVHPLLMDTQIKWEEDAVTFTYTLPKEHQTFEQLKRATKEEKLRAMANMASVEQLLNLPLTFFIHPENILFDYNLLPKVAYRGLQGKMPPKVTDYDLLLRQYKSLIIALFERNQDFSKLYEGQLEIKKGSEFIQTILKKATFAEIKDYLIETYNQTVEKTTKTIKKVNKVRYQVTKQLAIWMSIVVVILILPLLYLLFFRMPFLDRMQDTDTAFLKNDYEGVISTLEPVKTKKIPYTQKYELAYSFVQGEALQEQQKKVILNVITLKSDESYLDYWIENGRGNLDEALDIAKNLEESDLILYGITQKIEQVRKDTKMSGTEKEETITKLEADYKKYKEKRDASLANAEGTTASSTEETPSSTTEEANE